MTRPRPAAWEVPLGVGGERGGELPANAIEAAMPGLAQPGGGLCPAEGLLDALSDDLADLVAGMAGRASVDGGALDLSRDVRGDVEGAKLSDEVLGVVALVGPQRDAARSIGAGFDHVEGRDALGVAVRHGQAGVDHQPVAVLHQGMADEAELRLTARALAVEPGIRVGGALMSVVGAALAVEIAFAVAPMGRRLARAGPSACGLSPN